MSQQRKPIQAHLMSRLTICTLLALSACTAMAEEATFDSLELKDTYGKSHNLSTLGNKKLTVVVFLGTECPLAKLYGPRMRQLAARFADQDVAFIGVNSNVQDSLTEVAAYVNRAKIQFPMLLDTEHKLADLLKAERTPEVFVLDAKRTIRYRGRIDDQYAISVARDKPKTEDLANALTSLLAGDGPATKRTEAIGCIIGRRRNTEPTGEITYSKHVAPIFNKRCVECHRSGELAPFPLASFEDTVGWTDMIAEVISEGRMPPWNANPEFGHFQNDARLTADEKNTVLTWIKNGAPEGSKDDLPDPPKFVEGWRIEKPDVVLKMDSKPFPVPATGVVDYQHFYVDLNLKEDVWVNAVEARPGNPEVVHHIVVYLKIPGQKRDRNGLGPILIGYAPGTSPMVYPKDAGMRIPKGSKLKFELHYTPNGEPAEDLSYIGVKLIDKAKVKQEIVGSEVLNPKIKIPPNATSHRMTASKRIREPLWLTTLTPHMHLRGKAFRYEAQFPDGRREVLLDVPKYDFNWQLRYKFADPLLLPKGSWLHCTATYDNSENNLNNPNPNVLVGWGDQSDQEMMIGFYTGVKPRRSEE